LGQLKLKRLVSAMAGKKNKKKTHKHQLFCSSIGRQEFHETHKKKVLRGCRPEFGGKNGRKKKRNRKGEETPGGPGGGTAAGWTRFQHRSATFLKKMSKWS